MYLARHEEPSLDLTGRNDRVYRGFYVRSVNHEIQFECFERETAPDTLLSLKLILPPPHYPQKPYVSHQFLVFVTVERSD